MTRLVRSAADLIELLFEHAFAVYDHLTGRDRRLEQERQQFRARWTDGTD